jgi:hypothetical protein
MVIKICFHLQEGSSSERETRLCSPISSCNEPEMSYSCDVTVKGNRDGQDLATMIQKHFSQKHEGHN